MGVAALTRPTASRPLRVRRGDREKKRRRKDEGNVETEKKNTTQPTQTPKSQEWGLRARGHERRLESRGRERRRTGKKVEKETLVQPTSPKCPFHPQGLCCFQQPLQPFWLQQPPDHVSQRSPPLAQGLPSSLHALSCRLAPGSPRTSTASTGCLQWMVSVGQRRSQTRSLSSYSIQNTT